MKKGDVLLKVWGSVMWHMEGYWRQTFAVVILVAVISLAVWACFQPYCTTYSSGDTVCSQVVWGGKVYWRE